MRRGADDVVVLRDSRVGHISRPLHHLSNTHPCVDVGAVLSNRPIWGRYRLPRRNMVTSFIYHERIRTTVPRAKELRKLADNMVTLAKKGTSSRCMLGHCVGSATGCFSQTYSYAAIIVLPVMSPLPSGGVEKRRMLTSSFVILDDAGENS